MFLLRSIKNFSITVEDPYSAKLTMGIADNLTLHRLKDFF